MRINELPTLDSNRNAARRGVQPICSGLWQSLASTAVILGLFVPGSGTAHPHENFGSPSDDHVHVAAASPSANDNVGPRTPTKLVSGTGEFTYQFDPERLRLPKEVKMRHGHGLCRDAEGNIYFTFEPEIVEEQTRCLVRFGPDGNGAVLLGSDNALAHGAPHGLNIYVEQDGRKVLYHANNSATVHKTDLEGKLLWTQRWPAAMGNYKPTDVVVTPGSDRVLVADGYGSSMIHALKTADGVYAGKSWGGMGAGNGELNCPHGITYDPRRKLLLVADRGNKRLEYYRLNGAYDSTIQEEEITAPCNVDVQGDYALVPDLDGPVVILDKANQVVSVVQVGRLLGDRGFKHPHDAIWLANGDIVVCTWNPGRIGYWAKVGASKAAAGTSSTSTEPGIAGH